MKRFKIKPKSSWYKPLLTQKQILISHHKLRLKRLNKKFRLNANKITLRKLKSKVHSASGRVNGKICIRHKKGKNFLKISSTFLPKNNYRFKVSSFLYHPKNAKHSLCLVVGNKNAVSYYPRFANAEIGQTLYNLKYLKKKKKTRLKVLYKKQKTIKKSFGSSVQLYNISTGSLIYNLEKKPFRGPAYICSAGCKGKLMSKQILSGIGYGLVLFPSGKQKYIRLACHASIGRAFDAKLSYKNAGFFYKRGFRPHVRGVAMNPIDHPHGGGEGKKSNPATPKTPWGTKGKWVKTVSLSKKNIIKKFIFRLRTLGDNIK